MHPDFLRVLIAVVLFVGAISAEEPFSFETTPGQLPKDIVPRAYAIRIEPRIPEASLVGSETIEIEVRKPVRAIVMNSLGLKISRAVLHTDRETPLTPQLDDKKQTLTFALDAELAPGRYRLELAFEGKLTEQPEGLFLTRYTVPGGEKRALMTQFEATDARRMFPCWDEPVFRATFQLTAIVPEKQVAVSNMPIASERALEAGRKEVVFAPTPSMVSYLLAFCAGEFEMLEGEVDGIPLRVITTEGKREQAHYALEATKQIVPFFNEYFGVKYPLPKLDQISFASTAASGMENWGCITYNDTAFLYDPATSSQATRERVFEVVAHELAHQWFGDLVTMAWWDNLWLNEGFASWMGTKATDRFNPDWKMWLRAAGGKEAAMRLDARATTHPIQQKVENEAQAGDAFDEITYQKGQAFLRMLEGWVGEEEFRDGIRLYMKRHAYSNTTTADLWAALGKSSKKNVAAMAAGWTEQPGFPLVKVERLETGAYRLSQERFTVHQKNPAPLTWLVPVKLDFITLERRRRSNSPAELLLGSEPREIAGPVIPPDAKRALKANHDGAGYFRTHYDPESRAALVRGLSPIAEGDRLNLFHDSWALVTAGRLPLSGYFEFARGPTVASMPLVEQIVSVLGELDFLARGRPERDRLHEGAHDFLRRALMELGWAAKPSESPLAAPLRARLIRTLAVFGDETVQRDSRRRFEKFLTAPDSLSGDLRGAVLAVVGRTADDATYAQLHELAKRETSTEQKRLLYGALAGSLNPQHAAKTLALSITDELVPQSATRLVNQVASDGEHPEAAWAFAKANLNVLTAKLSSMRANDYVPGIFRAFSDAPRADELETFAKLHLPPDSAQPVARAADEIRFKAGLKERILPELDAWVREHRIP